MSDPAFDMLHALKREQARLAARCAELEAMVVQVRAEMNVAYRHRDAAETRCAELEGRLAEGGQVKVKIDRDREGWRYFADDLKSDPFPTYGAAVKAAKANGHEIDNAGWRRRMLMWNFNDHALDGYPGWEIERDKSPAFVKLTHVRRGGDADVESRTLAAAWDDVAEVDFYQRDWTGDGIPFVNGGETYWSGWWFQTIAERDRFVAWHAANTAEGKEG